MRTAQVMAWMPTEPSVRVMARATAEAAARGASVRVLSLVAAPPQWPAWSRAARSLGVEAGWDVVTKRSTDGSRAELPHELVSAALLVTEAGDLRDRAGSAWDAASLAALADVYVVAGTTRVARSRMHEPAVVVGVSDDPDDPRLVGVAGAEAGLRNRHLVVLHARLRDQREGDHRMEHRWLDALPTEASATTGSLGARVVVTHRPVVEALCDHVDSEDVLVVGVRPQSRAREVPIVDALLAAPPCDLLLTACSRKRLGSDQAPPAAERGAGDHRLVESASDPTSAAARSVWEHLTA